MKKKKVYLWFTLILLSILVSQPAFADEQSNKVYAQKTLDQINDYNKRRVADSLYDLSTQLLEYSQKHQFPYYEGEACKRIGGYYNYFHPNVDSSNLYYLLASEAYSKANDSLNQAIMLSLVALNYRNSGKSDTAIKTYLKSIEILQQLDNNIWHGLNYNHLGFLYFHNGNYYLARKYLQDAIVSFQNLNDNNNVGSVYNMLGILYRKTKDTEKEKEAYIQAIKYLTMGDESKELGWTYNNLSELYFNEGKVEEGMEMLEKAKSIYERVDYPAGMCAYYSVLASYYSDKKQPEFNKVIEYAKKSMPIAKQYGEYRIYADAAYFLGNAYVYTENLNEAIDALNDGLDVAHEHSLNSEIVRITDVLATAYKKKNDYARAFKYLTLSTRLNDSIINEEKVKEFTQLDMSFKFRQEQIKDSIHQIKLNQEVNFKLEKVLLAQKQAKLIFVFTTALIILIALFIFIYARRNKKQAAILNAKNILINKSLNEKELLLKEIHHRVKNSLQLVSSLLELQSKNIQDERARESIHEGQERVRAIALIHQNLYQNENLTDIDFNDYTTLLTNEIQRIYPASYEVTIDIDIANMNFDVDTAIPLGLILNELITNAFKYAFVNKKDNRISISIMEEKEDNYLLTVMDNGIGPAAGIDISNTANLGLRLVKRLAKQLHGSLNYKCENGCIFQIVFKDTNQRRMSD